MRARLFLVINKLLLIASCSLLYLLMNPFLYFGIPFQPLYMGILVAGLMDGLWVSIPTSFLIACQSAGFNMTNPKLYQDFIAMVLAVIVVELLKKRFSTINNLRFYFMLGGAMTFTLFISSSLISLYFYKAIPNYGYTNSYLLQQIILFLTHNSPIMRHFLFTAGNVLLSFIFAYIFKKIADWIILRNTQLGQTRKYLNLLFLTILISIPILVGTSLFTNSKVDALKRAINLPPSAETVPFSSTAKLSPLEKITLEMYLKKPNDQILPFSQLSAIYDPYKAQNQLTQLKSSLVERYHYADNPYLDMNYLLKVEENTLQVIDLNKLAVKEIAIFPSERQAQAEIINLFDAGKDQVFIEFADSHDKRGIIYLVDLKSNSSKEINNQECPDYSCAVRDIVKGSTNSLSLRSLLAYEGAIRQADIINIEKYLFFRPRLSSLKLGGIINPVRIDARKDSLNDYQTDDVGSIPPFTIIDSNDDKIQYDGSTIISGLKKFTDTEGFLVTKLFLLNRDKIVFEIKRFTPFYSGRNSVKAHRNSSRVGVFDIGTGDIYFIDKEKPYALEAVDPKSSHVAVTLPIFHYYDGEVWFNYGSYYKIIDLASGKADRRFIIDNQEANFGPDKPHLEGHNLFSSLQKYTIEDKVWIQTSEETPVIVNSFIFLQRDGLDCQQNYCKFTVQIDPNTNSVITGEPYQSAHYSFKIELNPYRISFVKNIP